MSIVRRLRLRLDRFDLLLSMRTIFPETNESIECILISSSMVFDAWWCAWLAAAMKTTFPMLDCPMHYRYECGEYLLKRRMRSKKAFHRRIGYRMANHLEEWEWFEYYERYFEVNEIVFDFNVELFSIWNIYLWISVNSLKFHFKFRFECRFRDKP